VVIGYQNGERLGSSIAGGKYSNDAYFYLASGAPVWDNGTYADTGRVWVMYVPEFSDYEMPVIFAIMIGTAIVWHRKKKKLN
jgi:hypothetical protein